MPPPRSQVWTTATLLSLIIWLGLIWKQKLPYQSRNQRQYEQHTSHPARPRIIRPPPGKASDITAVFGQHTAEQKDFVERLTRYGIYDVEPNATVLYNQILLNVNLHQTLRPSPLQDVKIVMPELRHITTTNRFEMSIPPAGEASVDALNPTTKVEASDLLFGLATTIDRLKDSIETMSHWASGNGARVIALVEGDVTQSAFDETMAKAMSFGVQLKMERSRLCPDGRYFQLVKVLHENLNPETTWVSFIDDDTFFPSISNLQAMLAKHDPSTEQYIGSLSEDPKRKGLFGTIAYGGAGIFISTPLLKRIQPHYKSCATVNQPGDHRLSSCILKHTNTLPSHEPLLLLHGDRDRSDFYETLHPLPISLHNWKSWPRFSMATTAIVSKVCGNDCIFQKYRFADGWQLTNGVSLVDYTHGHDAEDLHSVEQPRARDRKQFLMEHAMYEERSKSVKQYYVRRQKNETHTVVEILVILWRQ